MKIRVKESEQQKERKCVKERGGKSMEERQGVEISFATVVS